MKPNQHYILFFTIFLCLCSFTDIYSQQRPNIVFILADDLGYGDLGCYGQVLIETPNIDKLAAKGIKFSQFYAGTAVCAPSRASLMTGQHTGHTPIRGNFEIEPEGQLPLPDSTYTIAELFKKSGYATGDFGKWGLGYPGSSGDPIHQGFDRFYGYNCQRQSHNFFPDHLWNNKVRVELSNTFTQFNDYAPEFIQRQALAFMEEHRSNPFFMYLSYTLPHAGLQLPAGDEKFEYYKKKFKEQPKAIPPVWNGKGYQPQAYPHAAYAAMVSKLDDYVGQVVMKLKQLGLEKNTIIVFTSDNGPHTEGGNDPGFFNSSAGFRGVKRALYEGGIRTPMIMSWPGMIKNASKSDQIGAFWDFFPTFASILKQPVPASMDGISFLPTLIKKRTQKQHDYLYWEFHEDGGRQAIRVGKWKGVRNNIGSGKSKGWEIYNLETDPAENINLSVQQPKLVERMKKLAEQAHGPSVIKEWNFK